MNAIKLTVILAGFLAISLPTFGDVYAGGLWGGYKGDGHKGGHSGGYKGGHGGGYKGSHGGGYKGGHGGGYRGPRYSHRNYGYRHHGYRGYPRYGYRPYYGSSFYLGVNPYFSYNYFARPYTYVEPTTVYVETPPTTTQSPLSEYSSKAETTCLQEREYTTKLKIDGQEVDAYGTACKQPDGSWRLMPPKTN
ncbi:hypothetical protein ACFL17_06015 [Pseudomonadota bacterium]